MNHHRIMLGFALVMVIVAGRAPVHAVDPLDDWVETALDNNPELLAARKKWEAARQRIPQARAFEDPMIGVDVERSSTRFDSFHANEYVISQRLPWFGKRKARATVAELEAEAEGFRYLELMREIKARVIGAYWELWLAQRAAQIAGENRDLIAQFEKIAHARYQAGQTMQSDVLRAQVELSRLDNEVVTMQHERPVALHALNALLNAEGDEPRRVEEPAALAPLELSLKEMEERARQYCCILLSFLRAARARQAAINVARLESAPDVELRVEARQFKGRSGIQEYDTGVFINFPWLWRGKYRAMVNEARAEHEMAEGELEEEINMTMLEVRELYTRADAAWRLIKLHETEVLPRARQLVDATRAGYEAGQVRFPELVEAQRALRDFQLEYDRARAAYGKVRASLDRFISPWSDREIATGLVTADME
jgi:cobalt-zinc-cadmium efflux system outer membrane protein